MSELENETVTGTAEATETDGATLENSDVDADDSDDSDDTDSDDGE